MAAKIPPQLRFPIPFLKGSMHRRVAAVPTGVAHQNESPVTSEFLEPLGERRRLKGTTKQLSPGERS